MVLDKRLGALLILVLGLVNDTLGNFDILYTCLGGNSVLSLARFCQNLETLIIGGCRDISDQSVKSLASACKDSLKNLRMDWCLNISDFSLSCILTKCRSLEALDIGCCEEVTDGAFQCLATMDIESGLKILKVSNCPKITVTGIGLLLEKCDSLKYLDVRSCPFVTKFRCEEAGLQFPEFISSKSYIFSGNGDAPVSTSCFSLLFLAHIKRKLKLKSILILPLSSS